MSLLSPRNTLELLLWLFSLLYSHACALLWRFRRAPAQSPQPSLAAWAAGLRAGDAVLVTGGSSGLGAALALQLASCGVHVLLTAPGGSEAASAAAARCALAAGRSARVTGLPLDQGCSESVAGLVASLSALRDVRLRAVVLNAAVFALQCRGGDERALHRGLSVNHVGAVRLLTQLHKARLLPPGCRLVVTASFTARGVSPAHLLASLRSASPRPPDALAYSLSKAALACAAAHFCAVEGDVSLRLADPGLVKTRLTREWPPALWWAAVRGGQATGLMSRPEEGAGALAAALAWDGAGDAAARGAPAYFFGRWGARMRPPRVGGGDAGLARLVWKGTAQLL